MDLSQEEIALLRELRDQPNSKSTSASGDALKRLIKSECVVQRSLNNASAPQNEITDPGRNVLAKMVSEETIPVENLNSSNDE